MSRILFITGILILLVAITANAEQPIEIPAGPNDLVASTQTSVPIIAQDRDEPVPTVSYSLTESLERMPIAEKFNSVMELILPSDADRAATDIAEKFAVLWKDEHFNQAILLLNDLEGLTDLGQVAVSCAWRQPIVSEGGSRFGTDVRIGTRDSVYDNDLDIDWNNGNLWVVLLIDGDGYDSRITVNRSTDDGTSWSETQWLAYPAYHIECMGAAIVADHFYIAWGTGNTITMVHTNLSTGYFEDFPNDERFVTVLETPDPDVINEVSVETNVDFNPYYWRVYVAAITSEGNLMASWSDEECLTWHTWNTGITNAADGLSSCINQGYTNYWYMVSYYDEDNNVCVDGTNPGDIWSNMARYTTNSSSPDYTSISAYHDTITCFHEYVGGRLYCRYWTSYTGGDSWLWYIVDDTTEMSESPAVACRRGGGTGMVYRYYTPTRENRFVWRDYSGSWTDPVSVADYQPYYNQPSIEYVGGGLFGTVYLSWNTPYRRAAYYDRGSGCCIPPIRGDINGDSNGPNIQDLTFMVAYLFSGGAYPPCLTEAEINGDGNGPNIQDLTYFVAYLFSGGPPPAACP